MVEQDPQREPEQEPESQLEEPETEEAPEEPQAEEKRLEDLDVEDEEAAGVQGGLTRHARHPGARRL